MFILRIACSMSTLIRMLVDAKNRVVVGEGVGGAIDLQIMLMPWLLPFVSRHRRAQGERHKRASLWLPLRSRVGTRKHRTGVSERTAKQTRVQGIDSNPFARKAPTADGDKRRKPRQPCLIWAANGGVAHSPPEWHAEPDNTTAKL